MHLSWRKEDKKEQSLIIRKSIQEAKEGNKSIREKLNLVARRFLNASETGAQECVYNLLSMQVTRCSRDVVFINTFPKCDRFAILRDEENLKITKEGDPIFNLTSIDHYSGRDNSDLMHQLCLAEFVATYDYLTKAAKKARDLQGKNQRRTFDSDNEDDNNDDNNNDNNTNIKYNKDNSINDDDNNNNKTTMTMTTSTTPTQPQRKLEAKLVIPKWF